LDLGQALEQRDSSNSFYNFHRRLQFQESPKQVR
jgi:hypothetical protein